MTAGGGNLERAPRRELPLDVEHVGIRRRCQAHHRLVNFDAPRVGFAGVGAQMLDDLQQRFRRINRHLPDQRRLIGALSRHDKAAQWRLSPTRLLRLSPAASALAQA